MGHGRLHIVEFLEMALEAATRLGYRIREDVLGGYAGGACQLKGQKWLFIDPALSSRERLQVVLDALAADPAAAAADLPPPITSALKFRAAA
jgi:hypothetical protein